MAFKKSTSVEYYDYETLIRRAGEAEYASYCPQLNYMIKGTGHELVQERMKEYIKKHIEGLKADAGQN